MLEYELFPLPPRNFCDFTVPLRGDGSPLVRCDGREDYEAYVQWLADYLYTAELPLSAAQARWLEGREHGSPSALVFEIADFYGAAVWELDLLEMRFAAGEEFPLPDQKTVRKWDRGHSSREHDEDEEPGIRREADWLDMYDKLLRIRGEWEQHAAAGVLWCHADIPYRSLLAHALRQLPDAEDRRRELDFYFIRFGEEAAK